MLQAKLVTVPSRVQLVLTCRSFPVLGLQIVQVVRHPEDSWASVLAVTNPDDSEVYFFEAVALPFGSISSVLACNRSARALRTILAKIFKLVVTIFFDDFCQLELGLLRNSAWTTAETVMALLGWTISTSDDKRKPFSKDFEIFLGCSEAPTGWCEDHGSLEQSFAHFAVERTGGRSQEFFGVACLEDKIRIP